jgi:hypothetical protein
VTGLNWKPEFRSADTSPVPWRAPTRLGVAIAALVVVLGCIPPWATGYAPPSGPVAFSGFEGAGDALILIVLALIAAGVTLNRAAANSTVRAVQLVPLVVSIVGGLIWVIARTESRAAVDEWIRRGGTGQEEITIWIVGAGQLVVLALSTVLAVRRWAETPAVPVGRQRTEERLTWMSVVQAIGVVIGGVAGFAAGIGLVERYVTSKPSLLFLVVAVVCAGLGAYLGSWLTHLVFRAGPGERT